MTNPPDPRLSRIQEAVHPLGGAPFPLPDDAAGRAEASVSLVLRTGKELEILLIRRAVAEGDPWSGQMALPGGRRDPGDSSLLHTALRETEEETGIALERVGHPIGRLEPLVPATRRLPPILIFPFVFGVPAGTRAEAVSREVDEALWTPLPAFRDPTARGTVDISYADGTSREFPCFRVRDRVVWGLTYRILDGFLGTLWGEPI